MRKKAQMEMLGLVIIVVLVTLIFLFMLKFNVSKEPNTVRKEFLHSELATNTLSAMLKMDAPCDEKVSMTELIQDCGKAPGSDGQSQLTCFSGPATPSCTQVKTIAIEILAKTLGTQDKDYIFYGKISGTEVFKINEDPAGNCNDNVQTEVFPIPIYEASATLFLRLELCG